MIANVMLWAVFTIGVASTSVYLVLLWHRLRSPRSVLGGFLPLFSTPQHDKAIAFAKLAPRILFHCLSWPTTAIWGLHLARTAGVRLCELTPSAIRSGPQLRLMQRSETSFGVSLASLAVIVPVGLWVALSEVKSLPALVWLSSIWLALALWLLTFLLPGNSFVLFIKYDPDHRQRNALVMLALFGVLLPFVSSILSTGVSGQVHEVGDIGRDILKTYLVGGVLWEGPKSVIATLPSQPAQTFSIVGGALLYLALLSNFARAILNPIDDSDLVQAATGTLLVGNTARANALLDRVEADNRPVWFVRIVASILANDVARARRLAETKFPSLSQYGHKTDAVVSAFLLVVATQWIVETETEDVLWGNFRDAKPSEDELTLLWLAVFPSYVKHDEHLALWEKRFLQVAAAFEYRHLMLVIAASLKRLHAAAGLARKVIGECSICAATSFVVRLMMLGGQAKQHAEQTRLDFESSAEFLTLMIARSESMGGLVLVYLALQQFEKSVAADPKHYKTWVNAQRSIVKNRLLLFPSGQFILANLQKTD